MENVSNIAQVIADNPLLDYQIKVDERAKEILFLQKFTPVEQFQKED